MNAANLHVLSNVADAPQAILEPVTQVRMHCLCGAVYLFKQVNSLCLLLFLTSIQAQSRETQAQTVS